MNRALVVKAIIWVVILEVLGSLAGLATSSSLDTWYENLDAPPGTPPNWIFGPVWTLLYALIGISFALVLHQTQDAKGTVRRNCIALFAIQLVLNLAWTPIFFEAQRLFLSFLVIVLLLLTIGAMIHQFRKASPAAAWLLVPYLAWVGYASYLNLGYLFLNA